MKYLYADNFRGFSNTYIPICDINFLVGENSTGKTSLLGLLKLFSGTGDLFQNSFEFNIGEMKFGNFKDIVSVNEKNKECFSIGFIIEHPATKDQTTDLTACLFIFTEESGLPRVEMCISCKNNKELWIKTTPNSIKYKQRSIQSIHNNDFIRLVFSQWTKAYKTDKSNKGYIDAHLFTTWSTGFPLSIIINIIEKEISQANEGKSELSLERLFSINDMQGIVWFAPVRSKPQRTYDEYRFNFSPEGDHTPYLIKKLFDSKKQAEEFRCFIEKFGKNSGLYESISIHPYSPGAAAPFSLDIVLNSTPISVNFTGYGVSQSLPFIVELFARPRNTWYAIQQPEVHLHPKAQAALGDVFFEQAINEKKKFFIETHSDYIIDRLRMNYRRKDIEQKPTAQILFFKRKDNGNHIYSIEVDENGDLPDDQPEAYREFFIHEELKILGINNIGNLASVKS